MQGELKYFSLERVPLQLGFHQYLSKWRISSDGHFLCVSEPALEKGEGPSMTKFHILIHYFLAVTLHVPRDKGKPSCRGTPFQRVSKFNFHIECEVHLTAFYIFLLLKTMTTFCFSGMSICCRRVSVYPSSTSILHTVQCHWLSTTKSRRIQNK